MKYSELGEGWSPRYFDVNYPYATKGDIIGARLDITLADASDVLLFLLSHPWSGECDIYLDDTFVEKVTLYGKSTKVLEIPVSVGRNSRGISIVVSGSGPRGQETWFLGASSKSGIEYRLEPSTRVSDVVSETVGVWGRFYILRNDTVIGPRLHADGEWAKEDVEVFKILARPDSTVCDVGANIGHHTVALAKIVGSSGKVLSFEPQRVVFQILCANLVINGILNCFAYQSALGDTPGQAHLYPVDYGSTSNVGSIGLDVEGTANPGEAVSIRTLDSVVDDGSFTDISFIKIDIQSYELFFLRGAVQSISRMLPSIFCEISPKYMARAGYDYREIYKLLAKLGYIFFHHAHIQVDVDGYGVSRLDDAEWDIVAVHASKAPELGAKLGALGWQPPTVL